MESREFDLERLYADHGPAIFRFCYRLCGDRGRAEDLAQDTFVVALRSQHRFRNAASPKTWLYGIALNLVRKHRRRLALERALHLSPSPSLEDPDTRIDLDRAIDALPPRLRDPFVLVKAERLTAAEAGAMLNVPEGTIRAQVHEAIQRLRLQLAPGPTASLPCLAEEIPHAL